MRILQFAMLRIKVIAIEVNILKCESVNCPDRHASFLDLQRMILAVELSEHLMMWVAFA